MDQGSKGADCGSFPFSGLPPETQLKIIENTDIVSPTGVYWWDNRNGFRLPHGAKKTSWKSPKSLFLVSRAWHFQVKKLFWGENAFEIWPHTKLFYEPDIPGQPSKMPKRYAASEFLSRGIPGDMIPQLRVLKLEMFGIADEHFSEQARRDWFHAIEQTKRHGGLNLTSLEVSHYWDDGPTRGEWEDANGDKIAQLIRGAIAKHVWPLTEGKAPWGVSEQLVVEVSAEEADLRYTLRNTGCVIPESHDEEDWGPPCVDRPLSLHGESRCEERVSEGSRPIDWVEEAWVKIRPPPDY